MVEYTALAVAGVALAIAFVVFRRQPDPRTGFAEPAPVRIPNKQKKRPVVRDDLAAYRQEEKERYEWEAKLREQER